MKRFFILASLCVGSLIAQDDVSFSLEEEIAVANPGKQVEAKSSSGPSNVIKRSKKAPVAQAPVAINTTNAKSSKNDKPYDYDLFSRDREVEYVELEGMFYKLLNNQPIGAKASSPIQAGDPQTAEKILSLNWDWRPGFRITLGYFNAPKYWEVMAQYTWFKDRAYKHEHVDTSGDQFLRVGCYLPAGFDSPLNPVTDINAKSELYYNDLSALVTRNFYPNPHLRLKVIGGLTSVWTHQNTSLKNTFLGLQNLVFNRSLSKYWGVGFRMGTSADWYWGKDFYLTGKVFWSIVTGRWSTNTAVSLSNGSLVYEPSDANYQACQNFTFILGPSYQKSYEKCRWELFLGYEFNSWQDILKTYNYQAQSSAQSWSYPQEFNQNITMTGVNLRLTIDF